jgi:putative cardiolipin synthase
MVYRPGESATLLLMIQATRVLLLVLLVSGCASVDFDYPRTPSEAVPVTLESRLARSIGDLPARHPGKSGVYLLDDSLEAFSSRLILAQRAEHSIDVQYYLLTKDGVGYTFLHALLQAAERGVRVRLLLDDIFTAGDDPGLAALASHPNFEVRLFNPFAYRSMRFLNALEFARLNRRMHNKVFIVDNQAVILGGRNMAKEYFAARPDTNFGDLDAMLIGPAVAEASRMFDSYWNHRKAVPAEALMPMPEDNEAAMTELRQRMQAGRDRLAASPYIDALRDSVMEFLEKDTSELVWAPVNVVYDSPDKAVRSRAEAAESIITPLRDAAYNAQEQLVVASPYFVPRKKTLEEFRQLESRGVELLVITNSLASNNHGIVHSGYAPKRRALIEAGVQLHEVKPDYHVAGTRRAGLEAELGTMHTKAFIVDERLFFLGSFNWDPRSAALNTEMGVIIESETLSRYALERLWERLPVYAYSVQLDEAGRLRWHDQRGDQLKVWTHEPETSWWKRFWVGLARVLPIDNQL